MDVPRKDDSEDKTLIAGAQTAGATSASPQTAPDTYQKSWGDKYKGKTLGFVRNVLVNYILNFGISAVFAYKVENSKVGDWLNEGVEKFAAKGEQAGVPAKVGEFIGSFFTKVQLLMFGGHVLLYPMKKMHDNRNKLEFSIGHRLDQFQEWTGHGNAASKRRIKEYEVIEGLLKTRPQELSDKEKELLARNSIDEHLHFNERTSSWGHVIKARVGGVAATTVLSIGLALASSTNVKALDFKGFARDKAGKAIDDNIIAKLPVVGPKIKPKVPGKNTLGENVFTELVYTLASKLGFDKIERRQLKKDMLAEQKEATVELKSDEKDLARLESTGYAPASLPASSALEARRRLIAGGEKDFRLREASKPQESSIALS